MLHVESLPSRQLNRGWGSAVEPAGVRARGPEKLSHLVQPIEGTSPDAQSPVNMLFDTN